MTGSVFVLVRQRGYILHRSFLLLTKGARILLLPTVGLISGASMKASPRDIIRFRVQVYVYVLLPTILSDEPCSPGSDLRGMAPFLRHFPLQSFKPRSRRGETRLARTKVSSKGVFRIVDL